ncbi:MAG TPA: hypothetical protein VH641_05250 [Streptosporangiaceae bacterium]|jgi:hypothetical protein
MATSPPPAAPHRPAHGIRAALRATKPSTLLALTLVLVVGGTGGASAATGASFILGKSNTETATASLSNSKGTPLKLSAPAGAAPLAVNRNVMVQHLNSEYTGGYTASQLWTVGGDGFTRPGAQTSVDDHGELVATTRDMSAGTYYVTATALLIVASGDGEGYCWIAKGSNPGGAIAYGGENHEQDVNAAATAAVSVAAGDTLQEWCSTGGTHGSEAYNAGITAIRVLFFAGTAPAHTGTRTRSPALARPRSSALHTGR